MISGLAQSSSNAAFILDDEATWPSKLKDILENGLPALRAFYEEDARIERLQRDDVMLRIHEPSNPHRQRKNDMHAAVEEALAGLSIVGWHCTRLCSDEIKLLLRDGMYPLSPETFAARLQRRVEAGDIPADEQKTFEERNQAKDANRQMLWLIFSKSLLRCESGIGRLFTSWGGEALYNSHESNAHTGAILRSIGRPCIVEVELPIEKIDAHWEPAEWIARPYLHRRGINDGHNPERDGHTHEKIGPERIRRVISIDDPDFDVFTGSSNWRHPLRDAAASG